MLINSLTWKRLTGSNKKENKHKHKSDVELGNGTVLNGSSGYFNGNFNDIKPNTQTLSKSTLTLDTNQNYKKYRAPTDWLLDSQPGVTIPNLYSIREDLKRELRFSKQDFMNNNFVSPPGDTF